jgi:ELWxxDGT repeat protein
MKLTYSTWLAALLLATSCSEGGTTIDGQEDCAAPTTFAPYSTWPERLTVYEGDLYFDSQKGTRMLEPTRPGGLDPAPARLALIPGSVTYGGKQFAMTRESLEPDSFDRALTLWQLDGEAPASIAHQWQPSWHTVYDLPVVTWNDKLYLKGWDPEHGEELWVYDGDGAPTLAADIVMGEEGSEFHRLITTTDTLYIIALEWAYDRWGSGALQGQLYAYDGVEPPVFVSSLSDWDSMEAPVAFNDELYFVEAGQLWIAHGADAEPVADLEDTPTSAMLVHDGALYIPGRGIWRADASGDVTLVAAFTEPVSDLTMLGDTLYGLNNRQLVRLVDGTIELVTPPDVHVYAPLVALAEALYFTGVDARHGRELWRFAGASAELTADLTPGGICVEPEEED